MHKLYVLSNFILLFYLTTYNLNKKSYILNITFICHALEKTK